MQAARMFGRGVGDVAKRAVVGRFRIRDEQERALVASYFWSALTSQPVSAEKTVNFLLEPYFAPAPFGFYAKRPVSAEPAERLLGKWDALKRVDVKGWDVVALDFGAAFELHGRRCGGGGEDQGGEHRGNSALVGRGFVGPNCDT